jgi:hypothetical protein
MAMGTYQTNPGHLSGGTRLLSNSPNSRHSKISPILKETNDVFIASPLSFILDTHIFL